jgi:hypothetical protein
MEMETFVATMIENQADISLEKGQEKYRAYFINTNFYAKKKATVDMILQTDGYGNCIVTE